MEIYLIRHTTPDIEKSVCYGQSDISIASTFEYEASIVQEKLKNISFDVVYSSPLSRCIELAKMITSNFYTDNRLKELNFGDWELKSWCDIPLTESQYWMDDFVNASTPNGESYLELQERVIDFYKELIIKPYQTVIIVSHAGVIRALLSFLRGIDLKDSFEIRVDYGEIFSLIH